MPSEINPPAALLTARVVSEITAVAAADWDACANPDQTLHNPFVAHAFLASLESSGCVGPKTGWQPHHLLVQTAEGVLLAAAPCYLKGHSQGEYVFDHAWADAYGRAGGRYYPKMLVAVPFTPVPGPRLLVRPGAQRHAHEAALADALVQVAGKLGVSSLHVNFLDDATAVRLRGQGFLQRTGQQFHWSNEGYSSFEDFLATFASRKRKAVRKERETALSGGIEIEHVSGNAIRESDWDAMYAFYMDTGARKWGRPYLNRAFFSALGAAMADRCLLVFANRGGRRVAGALNLIGGDCLYGRYWGAVEQHPCLHFELCYYRAIDYAIHHKLPRVEAGAQGEHKLARGYLPATTHSVHWIADAGFRRAVDRFLGEERAAVAHEAALYTEAAPFKRGPDPDPRAEDHD